MNKFLMDLNARVFIWRRRICTSRAVWSNGDSFQVGCIFTLDAFVCMGCTVYGYMDAWLYGLHLLSLNGSLSGGSVCGTFRSGAGGAFT